MYNEAMSNIQSTRFFKIVVAARYSNILASCLLANNYAVVKDITRTS